MTDDEMRRKMEFIIEQQAQFAADIMQLSAEMKQLKEVQATAQGQINSLIELHVNLDERVSKTEQAIVALTGNIDRLEKAQARTEERLNAFINMVERYIAEGRNGKS